MDRWSIEILGNLRHAADIARREHIGIRALDMSGFSRAKCLGGLRMEQVVGAGGPAAEMLFRYVLNDKSGAFEQLAGLARHLLSMLHRAGIVIGNLVSQGGGGFFDTDPQEKL